MPRNLTNENSSLVQVMAGCRQARAGVDPDLSRRMVSLCHNELTNTGTKWLTVYKLNQYFDMNFTEDCSWWINLQLVSTGSGYGLVKSRNDFPITDGVNEGVSSKCYPYKLYVVQYLISGSHTGSDFWTCLRKTVVSEKVWLLKIAKIPFTL